MADRRTDPILSRVEPLQAGQAKSIVRLESAPWEEDHQPWLVSLVCELPPETADHDTTVTAIIRYGTGGAYSSFACDFLQGTTLVLPTDSLLITATRAASLSDEPISVGALLSRAPADARTRAQLTAPLGTVIRGTSAVAPIPRRGIGGRIVGADGQFGNYVVQGFRDLGAVGTLLRTDTPGGSSELLPLIAGERAWRVFVQAVANTQEMRVVWELG